MCFWCAARATILPVSLLAVLDTYIALSGTKIRDAFSSLTTPLLDRMQQHHSESCRLAAVCDESLPMLTISGACGFGARSSQERSHDRPDASQSPHRCAAGTQKNCVQMPSVWSIRAS